MRSVLFVDDEPNILDGLRRMMRVHRDRWDMRFADSGLDALQQLEDQPADVLVTDMRMPGMTGVELLNQVQVLAPATVRIILSGHASEEAAIQSTRCSHQVLSKPCDADRLVQVVDMASRLGTQLDDTAVKRLIGSLGSLPVMPEAYERLIGALQRDDVELDEVVRIASRDIGIAAKVLQLVNSGFFGVRTECFSIPQATARLGLSTLRNLVLDIGLFHPLDTHEWPDRSSYEVAHRHSMNVARLAAGMVSDRRGMEAAYVAGLLHDIGDLVIASEVPAESPPVAGDGAFGALGSQGHSTPASHEDVGAYLLGLWGLPESVREAAAHHEHPSLTGHTETPELLSVVHTADQLVKELEGEASSVPDLDEEYIERAGIAGQLDEWRTLADEVVQTAT